MLTIDVYCKYLRMFIDNDEHLTLKGYSDCYANETFNMKLLSTFTFATFCHECSGVEW